MVRSARAALAAIQALANSRVTEREKRRRAVIDGPG